MNNNSKNKIILFLIFIGCIIYAIALFIEFKWIFTDEYFTSHYLNKDYSQILIYLNKKDILINYLLIPLVALTPILGVAICLWIGFNILEKDATFSKCLLVSSWSNLIFPLNYLLSVILRVSNFLPYDQTNANNNFQYQSVLVFIKKDIPDWSIYPLEKINITEFLFVLLLGYFIHKIFNIKYFKSVFYGSIFYGIGLLIWVVITVFLQFTF